MKLIRMKFLFSIFGIMIVFTLVFFQVTTQAMSQESTKIYSIDHTKNSDKAKKWAEKYYKIWTAKITAAEQKSLSKLLQPIKTKEEDNFMHINHQLKIYGGDLSTRPMDTPYVNEFLTKHIDSISHAIHLPEGKLKKPLIVYKNETLKNVIHIPDQFFIRSDGLIDPAKLSYLRENFSYGQYSEFRIYDLFEDTNQNDMIKWKIELPSGTPTGLIGDDKIVIDKDSAFKVTGIKMIVNKGKQLIRIEAKLISKEIVQNEINHLLEKIQNNFLTTLNFPSNKKILRFKLTGSANQLIASKIEQLLNKMITKINNSVLRKTLEFIADKGGTLLFTDRELFTFPLLYQEDKITLAELTKRINVVGHYNLKGNGALSFYLPYNLRHGLEMDDESLLHEFGHAVDNYGAKIAAITVPEMSQTIEFKSIFEKEKENLTDYGKVNPAEFFADAFLLMHWDLAANTFVQKYAPQTYAFITQALKKIVDLG